MKHTKGPWKHCAVDGGWDGIETDDPTQRTQITIARLAYNNPANAALIATAPEQQAKIDRLEAINQELVGVLKDGVDRGIFDQSWCDKANKVIAKANQERKDYDCI